VASPPGRSSSLAGPQTLETRTTKPPPKGAALVLCAGRSARMGRPKALLPFQGGTFLSVILDRLRALGLPFMAVVRGPDLLLPEEVLAGLPVLVNPDPETGPIGSIQAGLKAGARGFPWLLAVPVDHPAVTLETLQALVRAAEAGGGHLWVPSHRGRRGHPVVFSQACYEDLMSVPPGEGARWVVARHRNLRVEVPVEDPGVLRNVDTPQEYRQLLREDGVLGHGSRFRDRDPQAAGRVGGGDTEARDPATFGTSRSRPKPMTRFVLNSRVVQTDQPPGTILLDFIRLSSGLTGTKEACREGECGACTVLLGSPGPQGLVYRAVASCLLPLGDVQGCHVVTVEGLSEGPLTLVQEMILEHSASQCGFCTPGIVMSLTGFCLASTTFSFPEALDALDGNLCRCTGYVAIRDAARALCERLEGVQLDPEVRVATLVELGVLPRGFLEAPGLVSQLQTPEPPSTSEAVNPVLVAGGTDLFVQKPDELREAPLEFLSRRRDLDFIRLEDGVLRVGGAVTLESFRLSEVVNRVFPTLRDDLLLHSSTILRNRATLTGNIVNASPVGDVTIMLLALDATLEIGTAAGQTRRVPLSEFYRGYKEFDLTPGELITEIRIPEPAPGTRFSFEKVSNREILDIAAVSTALRLVLAPDGTIQDLRLSAGGVAPVPLFVTGLEKFRGLKPEGETVGLLARHVVEAVSPISDIRGSATYKRLLLGQLVRAHFSAEVLS